MQSDSMKKSDLAAIQDLLACPQCRGRLPLKGESFFCQSCARSFPIRDGIPMLAMLDEAEVTAPAHQGPTRASYQKNINKSRPRRNTTSNTNGICSNESRLSLGV